MAELHPERVKEMVEAGEAQLVDVRRDEEVAEGHIDGAVHIPMDQLTARSAEVDRDRPVVFYCRVGERSAAAEHAFAASGWEAHNLAGGVAAWSDAGLPLVK